MTYTSLICIVGAAFVIFSHVRAEASLASIRSRALETKYDPPCYFNYITFTADPSQEIKTYPPGVLDCKSIKADSIGVRMSPGYNLEVQASSIELTTGGISFINTYDDGSGAWTISFPNLESLEGSIGQFMYTNFSAESIVSIPKLNCWGASAGQVNQSLLSFSNEIAPKFEIGGSAAGGLRVKGDISFSGGTDPSLVEIVVVESLTLGTFAGATKRSGAVQLPKLTEVRGALSVFLSSGVNVDLPKLKSAGSIVVSDTTFPPCQNGLCTGYLKAAALESISSKIEIVHSQGNLEVHKGFAYAFQSGVTSTPPQCSCAAPTAGDKNITAMCENLCASGYSPGVIQGCAYLPPEGPSTASKLSAGAIAGIVIGSIIVFLCGAALVVFFFMNHRRKRERQMQSASTAAVPNPINNPPVKDNIPAAASGAATVSDL